MTRHDLPQIGGPTCDNGNGPRGATNTTEGLTHSSDVGREGLGMKPTRICSVTGCDSPHLARGMCNAHYLKWRARSPELPKQACGVEGCPNPRASLGYCGNHAKNYRTYGTPHAPDRKGVNHPKYAGRAPTYGGAHSRVRRRYGAPQGFPCADCGAAAQEWAYDHLDPDELTFNSVKGAIRYSANPAHYMPMCKPCHAGFDRRAHKLLNVDPTSGHKKEKENQYV